MASSCVEVVVEVVAMGLEFGAGGSETVGEWAQHYDSNVVSIDNTVTVIVVHAAAVD